MAIRVTIDTDRSMTLARKYNASRRKARRNAANNTLRDDVEICAAIVADKPPQLPLREELQSLGFEVVLNASGTGLRAAQYESQQAVQAFRRDTEMRDLRKRRIFPKSPRRIREKMESRLRIEQALSLPHACSYESYDIKLQRSRASAPLLWETSSSSYGDSTSGRENRLFLAPNMKNDGSSRSGDNEDLDAKVFDIPDVFGAFDALDEISGHVSDSIFQSDNDKCTSGSEVIASSSKQNSSRKKWINPFDSCDEKAEEKKDDESTGPSPQVADATAKQIMSQLLASTRKEPPHSEWESGRRTNATVEMKYETGVNPADEQFDPLLYETNVQGDKHPNVTEESGLVSMFYQEESSLEEEKVEYLEDTILEPPKSPRWREVDEEMRTAPPKSPVRSSLDEEMLRTGLEGLQLSPIKTNSKSALSWMTSAKSALENLSTEVFKVAVCDNRNEERTRGIEADPLSALFSLLARPSLSLYRVETILAENPELAQVKQHQDGRLALHMLCARSMPLRTKGRGTVATPILLEDIALHQRAVGMMVSFFPEACLSFDENGDLPVHLVARNLMEWEATWYEAVYQAAANETDGSGDASAAVTGLYHAMSQTIECLLTPLLLHPNNEECYRAPGSMGTILPLHIASIFTTSIKSLRLLLENYPEGATVQCDLGILQTFVPDECLALELHDNLSTDLPKWEINSENGSQAKDGTDEDSILRSDLLFAYNPIEPHRFEKERIHRFESRIQFDATIIVIKNPQELDRVNRNVWEWMCTFQEVDSGRSTYLASIKRIVNVLTYQPLQLLASMKTSNGHRLIDVANEDCARVMKKRMTELQNDIAAKVETRAPKERPRVAFPDKGFAELLCRMVFDLPHTRHSLSFVILPYALMKKSDGTFGLKSSSDSVVASKFAGCLVALTDPEIILQILQKKWLVYYGESIFRRDKKTHLTYESVQMHMKSLISLYRECETAYFYNIDAETGLPDVDPARFVTLQYPSQYVEKLLPLMINGLIQMRGHSAISRLASLLTNEDLTAILPSWLDAAGLLEAYLSNHNEEIEDEMHLKAAIQKCRSWAPGQIIDSKMAGGEWAIEIAALEEVINKCAAAVPCESGNRQRKTLIDLINYPDPYFGAGPEIIDLTKKMDELSKFNDVGLYANGAQEAEAEAEAEESDMEVLIGEEEESERNQGPVKISSYSRYSPLFDGLEFDTLDHTPETRDENEEFGLRVWNSMDQVWEDVTLQLTSQGDRFTDDPKILRLKVDLASQAKKLADLGRKVSNLRQQERNLKAGSNLEILDLTNVTESDSSGFTRSDNVSEARSLILRMGDLEDRLVCDEIEVQHLSMEAYSVEHEGDRLLSSKNSYPRTKSRVSRPQSSYEGDHTLQRTEETAVTFSSDTVPVKLVRFQDKLDVAGCIELETSSSSCATPNAVGVETFLNSQSSVALDAARIPDHQSMLDDGVESSHDSSCSPDLVAIQRGQSETGICYDTTPGLAAHSSSQPGTSDNVVDTDQDDTSSQMPTCVMTTFAKESSSTSSEDSGNRAVVESADRTGSERISSEPDSAPDSDFALSSQMRLSSESVIDEPTLNGISLVIEERKASNNVSMPFPNISGSLSSVDNTSLLESSKTPVANLTRAQKLSARRKRLRAFKSRGSYSGSSSAESSRPSARLRMDGTEEGCSISSTSGASNQVSVFRPNTINVPRPSLAMDYAYSGLSHSQSFTNNELAAEIDNLILRYTRSEDTGRVMQNTGEESASSTKISV